MDLRVMLEPQQGATYDQQLAIAQAAEAGGFDAFFRSDHLMRFDQEDPGPGPTDSWITLAGLGGACMLVQANVSNKDEARAMVRRCDIVDDLVEYETPRWVAARINAREHSRRVRAVRGPNDLPRQRLGERSDDHVDDALAGIGARCDGQPAAVA